MSETSFDMSEFIEKDPELDVQKAVVESLAADKAEMDQKMEALRAEAERLRAELAEARAETERAKAETESAKVDLASAKADLAKAREDLAARMEAEFERQERDPNALALLDREVELPDRFPGETRDHVLEVVSEARARAEAEGRVRKAQVLEAVLVANESSGELARRRAEMERLFADNGNLVSGPVLDELKKRNISHKNGETYLMPAEIIKRNF